MSHYHTRHHHYLIEEKKLIEKLMNLKKTDENEEIKEKNQS